MDQSPSNSQSQSHFLPRNQQQSLDHFLEEFESEFPSEEACLNELYKLAGIELKCLFCNASRVDISPNRRSGKCANCRRTSWFTSGTVLERMKVAKPRLAAIWFSRKGIVLNSVGLGSLTCIAQSSADWILKWVRSAIQNFFPADTPLVHSSLFASVFWKRSRETPARKHPVSEQEEMERTTDSAEVKSTESARRGFANAPEENCNSDLGDFCRQKERILTLLSDSPIHFDALYESSKLPVGELSAVLTMLELDGKVERLAGDRYVRRLTRTKIGSPDQETSTTIDGFLEFIRFNFRGISRRYLQQYLAAYWCYIERGKWSGEDLWKQCLGCVPAGYQRQIRNYVTPLWVQLLRK
jgi:hypothetical protein